MRNAKLKELQSKVIKAEKDKDQAEEMYDMLMSDTFEKHWNEEITDEEFMTIDVKCMQESNKSEFGIILMKAKNELIDYCQGMFTKLGLIDADMDEMFKVCKTNYVRYNQLIEILMKF